MLALLTLLALGPAAFNERGPNVLSFAPLRDENLHCLAMHAGSLPRRLVF